MLLPVAYAAPHDLPTLEAVLTCVAGVVSASRRVADDDDDAAVIDDSVSRPAPVRKIDRRLSFVIVSAGTALHGGMVWFLLVLLDPSCLAFGKVVKMTARAQRCLTDMATV